MLNSSLFAQHVSDSRRTYSYIAHSIVPPIHLSISEYACVIFFVQRYRDKKQQKEKLREKLQRSAVTLIFNSPCKIVVLISPTLAKLIITENKHFVLFLELIEDPMNEERERRRKAIEKWTEESHEEFANG